MLTGPSQHEGALAHTLPRAFVLGSKGQVFATYGGDPLARAMGFCANVRIACRAYAVDRDVVWVRTHPLQVTGR